MNGDTLSIMIPFSENYDEDYGLRESEFSATILMREIISVCSDDIDPFMLVGNSM